MRSLSSWRRARLLIASMALACAGSAEAAPVDDGAAFGLLLRDVERHAPALAAARAGAGAARAGADIARSQHRGKAEVFGKDMHYNGKRLVTPLSPPIDFTRLAADADQYGYGATLTLPLDIGGRIGASVRAAGHASRAAEYRVAQMRLELFGRASELYRGLQRLAGLRDALRIQIRALRQHEQVALAGVRVGRLPRVESLRIRAEIKAIEGRLASIAGDESRLRAALGALRGGRSYEGRASAPEIEPEDMPDMTEAALEERPDLLRAGSVVAEKEARLSAARREWLPSLAVQASISRNRGYNAPGGEIWSVSSVLTWRFWDGGRRNARKRQAEAAREAAREEQLAARAAARADLMSARASWMAARARFHAANAGVEAAKEAEKIQSARYAQGRATLVDLLDAEAALARARSERSAALTDWWRADDRLRLAAGRPPLAYVSEANGGAR